jgi:hypothetical protein
VLNVGSNPSKEEVGSSDSDSEEDDSDSSDDSVNDSDSSIHPARADSQDVNQANLHVHLQLLNHQSDVDEIHEIKTTPIFTEPVRKHGCSLGAGHEEKLFTQFGLLAGNATSADEPAEDPRIFYNVSAPSSIFICGSQGSGKSHSLSCLMENCLVQTPANQLPRPLTGIVFHYDTFISDNAGSPCELAWLSSNKSVQVRVLCPPTNITTAKVRLSLFTVAPFPVLGPPRILRA